MDRRMDRREMEMYEELIARHEGLLTREQQNKIRELRVGIAGCGMGSVVAWMLCRLGVQKIIIADGDKVEVSNLSRQEFFSQNLEKNKAQELGQILKEINPEGKIEVWPYNLTVQNGLLFVEKSDIIVDCIDPTSSLEVSIFLAEQARKEKKMYLYPLDCGWGARLFVFNYSGRKSFKELIEESDTSLFQRMEKLGRDLPPYVREIIEKLLTTGGISHYPQAITSSVSASLLVISIILKMILRKHIKLAPEYYHLDVLNNIILFS